jgi:hypothetical protein
MNGVFHFPLQPEAGSDGKKNPTRCRLCLAFTNSLQPFSQAKHHTPKKNLSSNPDSFLKS